MNDIYLYLMEPFSLPFIQRALWLGIATGIICAIISCYLVLKGWALIGDAISHALLPGIIISSLLGVSLFFGALLAGILSTGIMAQLKRHTKLKEDSVIGIVFSVMFALGLFLFGVVDTQLHITHILFGNILGIDKESMLSHLLLLLVILVILLIKFKDLMLFCFDEKQMAMQGMSTHFHHYLLLGLMTIVIVVCVQAIGVLFVVGLLIIPGMFGLLLSKRFHTMVLMAIAFSASTIFIGILSSFYLDVATAPLIIVIQTICMIICFIVKTKLKK